MSLPRMQLEIEVDRCLRRFAEALKPAEEYHDTGVRLCEKVLVTLTAACAKTRLSTPNAFTIPAAYYGGTINSFNDPSPTPLEFDILIKIGNNRQPPFSEVLDFIDTTLKNNAFRLQISPTSIKITGYDSVHFLFTNGISVVMTPASADLDHQEIRRRIKGTSAKNRRYYSSNLVDKQIDFIKQQSFYAHKVGRLAKFWYHSMDIGECCVIGGGVMFDLLATAAVLEEEAKGHGREAVLRALTRVVELVEKLDMLSLGFEREYGQYGPWKVKTQIISHIDAVGHLPRLTEPNNPKVNVLHGISKEALQGLKRNGKAMRLRILQLLEKQEYCDITAGGYIGIDGEDGGEENMIVRPRVVSIQFDRLFGGRGRIPDENDEDSVADELINNNDV